MTAAELTKNWALWGALLPATIVIAALVFAFYRKSSRGKLRRRLGEHRKALQALKRVERSIATAESKLERLTAREAGIKPRLLQEAREALDDARALGKIADDKVQVTANHLRRTIFEEFPPAAHERLRKRYLPEDVRDNRPFTF